MNPTKRKRLESAGWRLGRAAELVGLSQEEERYMEIKLTLADAVRARRTQLGWTQTQLAQRMRSSQSRIAKMEAGDRSVSIDLLVHALVRLGATRRQLARALSARAA